VANTLRFPRNGAVGFIDWLDCINLFLTARLAEIKYHTVRVFDLAARDLGILLYHGTTGCYELPLGGLNVWHEKLKDRSMFFAPFNVKAKRAGFKTYDRFAFLRDRQTENRPIKPQCL
jgi:hypothetical protein